jgi:hypothetical protein
MAEFSPTPDGLATNNQIMKGGNGSPENKSFISRIKDILADNSHYGKEKRKEKLLNDLRLVGEEKPLGYLPISTLKKICGTDPQTMRDELEPKGIIVVEFKEDECRVPGGALYAYDRNALGRLLDSGKAILEKNGWPTEPDGFVRHLKVFGEDPDLYRLIMHAFADPRLKKE